MSNDEQVGPHEVLLVEDNPADVDITIEAMEMAGLNHNLHVAEDGEKAMAFLRQEGENAESPRPDLIMLDLKLPRKGGWEVLAEVKADEGLKDIPVVVLTSSDADEDLLRGYDLQPDHMLTKFDDLDQYVKIATMVKGYWFGILKLPGD